MDGCLWSNGGIILTGENRSTWRGTSPNVTFFLSEKNNRLKIFYSASLKKSTFPVMATFLYTIIIKMSYKFF
jgi:hypothetical protein